MYLLFLHIAKKLIRMHCLRYEIGLVEKLAQGLFIRSQI